MERGNRFQGYIANSASHRQISANKIKEIYIQNIANNKDTKSLQIGMNKTVKQLKKEKRKII